MKTDTLFYRLFQRRPKLALELSGLQYGDDSYRFGSEEIKRMAFRMDGLYANPITRQLLRVALDRSVPVYPAD